MKAVLLSIAVFASAALAQTTTACAADYIVEACLGTENGKLASCGTNDYNCRCAAYGDILTCFNNCPNDTRKNDAAGQQQIFCGYASQFPSTTTKAATGTAANATPTVKNDGAQTSAGASGAGASKTGTATNTAASTTKTNSAADIAMNAGSILAVVAGVAAAVL